jgi:glycosyltransferase involved in cell wall biosynthesis
MNLEWPLMSDSSANKPISLLLVSHSYPPVIGGSEVEAQRICAALIKRGHSIKVVCAGGTPMPDTQDWTDPKGVPVRIYGRHWKGALKDLVFAFRVAAMLVNERRNYQLVYFLMQGLHLAVGLPVARLLKKPILMKISSSIVIPFLTTSISGRMELGGLRRWARYVMILNDGVRQQAIDHGFAPQKLVWMPNPVDTDEFSPADPAERSRLRAKFGVPPTAPVILYCGRLAEIKALPSLLDGFSSASVKYPEAVLVLLGDGPDRGALVEQAKRLQLREENIRFMGQVDPSQIPLWTKMSDIFALVSHSEGFSCALAEAMSTGLACVVSDIPANRQLIQSGEQGFLTPVGDSEAIGAAIVRLIEEPRLRERMGQNGRQTILENYSIKLVVDRYEVLIRDALAP